MRARLEAAAKLFTLIRERDPQLFAEIQAFRKTVNLDYDCMNCFNRGQLDVHGRCARCGSQAVYLTERTA